MRLFLNNLKLTAKKRWNLSKFSRLKKTHNSFEKWSAKNYIFEPEISFVIQSHNKSLQVCHIVSKLRKWSNAEIIVIDDGSEIEHTKRLSSFLSKANEFIIKANDLFEIITYDRAIRFSNSNYVVLLQDDDDFEICLRAWLSGCKIGWYNAGFHSLSVGGMRLYNNEFTKEQCKKNGQKLFDLYSGQLKEIITLVDQANQTI